MTADSAARRARRARVGLLALIGILTAGGPLGTDMYLPALPQVASDLDAPAALAANTLTVYLMGLGAGQFVWGPISDRTGRRGPLLVGLALFTVAGVVCALAPNIWILLSARLVEGLAGSAAVVLGRAIVRDLYEGEELARIFGRLAVVFGVAPVIGPVIGGGILQFADWRGTFIGLAILGGVLLVLVALVVHETLPDDRRIHGRSEQRRAAWVAPLRNGEFLLNSFILIGSTVAMLMYITFVSFVMQTERQVENLAFTTMFAVSALGVIAGGQLGPVLSRRYGGHRVLTVSIAVNLVAACCVLLASALHWPTWALYLALVVTVLQSGICQPLALALALAPFARGAGTAAAIAGGSQMLLGALIPGVVANLFGEAGVVLGAGQAITCAITLALAITGGVVLGRRRAGAAAPDPIP